MGIFECKTGRDPHGHPRWYFKALPEDQWDLEAFEKFISGRKEKRDIQSELKSQCLKARQRSDGTFGSPNPKTQAKANTQSLGNSQCLSVRSPIAQQLGFLEEVEEIKEEVIEDTGCYSEESDLIDSPDSDPSSSDVKDQEPQSKKKRGYNDQLQELAHKLSETPNGYPEYEKQAREILPADLSDKAITIMIMKAWEMRKQ